MSEVGSYDHHKHDRILGSMLPTFHCIASHTFGTLRGMYFAKGVARKPRGSSMSVEPASKSCLFIVGSPFAGHPTSPA